MLHQLVARVAGAGLVMLQYGCIAHCTFEFVGNFVVCTGPSMEPSIHSSDVVLANHWSVNTQSIQRGDIVIAKSASRPGQHICKRVTGMEGDHIDNPPPHSSRYVPRGHVWLEGDNHDNSSDSRTYGPVPYGLLKSKVFFKVWPLSEFGTIKAKHNIASPCGSAVDPCRIHAGATDNI